MCVYLYTVIGVCDCLSLDICIHKHTCIYTYVSTYIHTHIHMYIASKVDALEQGCQHVWRSRPDIYTHKHNRIYIYKYTYHTYTYPRTHVYTFKTPRNSARLSAYVAASAPMYTYINIITYIDTYTYHIYTYLRAHRYVCYYNLMHLSKAISICGCLGLDIYIHEHKRIFIYTHTQINIPTHTYICTFKT